MILVVGMVWGGHYWWIGTPQYSLLQFKKAIENRDPDRAFRYIDHDSIFEDMWEKVNSAAAQVMSEDSNSLLMLLAPGVIENMKPTLKIQNKVSLEDSIRNGILGSTSTKDIATSTVGEGGLESIGLEEYKISKNGNTAYVDFNNGTRFVMIQTPERYWRVTKISVPEPQN